jgi:uncharacterized protein DUF1360
MTWLLFVAASCAVYRAGRMIAEEDGPGFVFKKLRDAHTNDKRALDVGLRCFYCVSVWAALAATVFLCLVTWVDLWLWPIWWFGIAGAAAKIYEYWKR